MCIRDRLSLGVVVPEKTSTCDSATSDGTWQDGRYSCRSGGQCDAPGQTPGQSGRRAWELGGQVKGQQVLKKCALRRRVQTGYSSASPTLNQRVSLGPLPAHLEGHGVVNSAGVEPFLVQATRRLPAFDRQNLGHEKRA